MIRAFDHSVLTDFRDRLAEDGRAGQLPGFAVERMKQAGLVTERGKARTDSTYVLAAVRDLTRLELITQAVRAALEELTREDPGMLDELTGRDWATRYGLCVPRISSVAVTSRVALFAVRDRGMPARASRPHPHLE